MTSRTFNPGDRVRLHPIIGGNHDGKVYTFKQYGARLGYRRKLHAVITNERGWELVADLEGLSHA